LVPTLTCATRSRDNSDAEKSQPDISASTLLLAPLWRRSLASIINIVAVSGAVVVALAVIAAPLYVLGLYDEEALERLRARVTVRRKKRSGRPDRAKPGIGVGLALAIESRNRPSYGQRVLGIRRVNAANGGPVTSTRVTVHYVISALIRTLVPYESGIAKEQRRERFRALVPELVALWKKPSGTRAAVLRESLALLRKNKANPFAPTVRTVGIRLAIHLLSIAVFPERQSLPDLAAGIATATSDQ
jgi:uncharacterized RDD family membrane protein YckC